MTLRFSKKEKLIAFAGIALVLISFIGLYFLYLKPLKAELEQKQIEFNQETQLLTVIESQMQSIQTDTVVVSTETLQKQIPVKPLVEQLLLDIEKAEVVANSFVSDMEFFDGDITGEAYGNLDETETSNTESEAEQGEEEKATTTLPPGIQKTTATLTVQSPSYFDMEKFIETLESQPRIIVVEELEIKGQEEIISTAQEKQLIHFEITISAFFMPSLLDLLDNLPKMDIPEPSNKKNPFSSSGNLTNQKENLIEEITAVQSENSKESQVTDDTVHNSNEQASNSDGIITYTVQPGDNLFRISMKFFHSREGEKRIKEWNGLSSNTVKVGQVLEIPLED